MYIPIKVDYGVRALVDLALYGAGGPVRASEIAKRTVIPEQYLAQVLHTLNKSGFTGSHRGPRGGHFLAMEPSDIRLSNVMMSLGELRRLSPALPTTPSASIRRFARSARCGGRWRRRCLTSWTRPR